MKTTTLKTIKAITIKKGTVIPMLFANDEPIGYDIYIPMGAELEERRGCTITTFEVDFKGVLCYTMPYQPAIFKFILNKAIKDGAVEIITEDNKKVFKMFSMITENRIIAEEGHYITSFEAETIDDAEKLAKEYAKNMGDDFRYCLRQ